MLKTVGELSSAASCRRVGSHDWERVRLVVEDGELRLTPGGDPLGLRRTTWMCTEVVALDELAPFDADPATCELRRRVGRDRPADPRP